jgi:hypothetical protein
MDSRHDKAIEAVLEQLIEHGPEGIATVFARTFEMAMRIERERFLRAGHYERTTDRRGYANGYKSKRIDTPAGTVEVAVPKTAGHGAEPFFPQILSSRATKKLCRAAAKPGISSPMTQSAWLPLPRAHGQRPMPRAIGIIPRLWPRRKRRVTMSIASAIEGA